MNSTYDTNTPPETGMGLPLMIPEIRPIEPDDVAGRVRFGLESFLPVFVSFGEHYGEDLFNALRPNWEQAQPAYIEEACTHDDKETWVSARDGTATDFVIWGWSSRSWPLEPIPVVPRGSFV